MMMYKADKKGYSTDLGKKEKVYYQIKNLQESAKEGAKAIPTFDQIFRDLPVAGSITSMPAFYKDRIYFSSLDTYLYSITTEGELLWKFKTGGPIFSSPLVHNGRIYVGSNDEYFYCIDVDGKLVWKKHLGDIVISSPIGVRNKVYVGNGNGYLFCFNEEDGKEEWRYKTGAGISYYPSAVNDIIFVGSYDKSLYAIQDGTLKWKFTAGERISSPIIVADNFVFTKDCRSLVEMPVVDNPILYCSSYDNNVYALDIDGKLIWKHNCGTSVAGSLGYNDGIVYVSTLSGYVYGLDAATGVEKWKFLTGGMVSSTCSVHNNNIYVGSFDHKLYCISKDGQKIWEFTTGGPLVAALLIIGDKMYFGSADTYFYCLDLKKRSVEWKFQTSLANTGLERQNVQNVLNAFAEYDRKIFRVWKPETRTEAGMNTPQEYTIPKGLDFAGVSTYSIGSKAYKNKEYK